MRILVYQHIECEGLGVWQQTIADRGFQIVTSRLSEGDQPGDPQDYDALIVLGGPMNVYEEADFPFLAVENRSIQHVLATQKPFLGVCLGAQLLAKASGATVKPNNVREIGFDRVNLTDAALQDPLFSGLGSSLSCFQWHENTFDLPAGSQLLATSDRCKHQAFRLGESAWGMQFHLEVTEAMVEEWVSLYSDQLNDTPGVTREQIMAESPHRIDELTANAQIVINRFIDVVQAAQNARCSASGAVR